MKWKYPRPHQWVIDLIHKASAEYEAMDKAGQAGWQERERHNEMSLRIAQGDMDIINGKYDHLIEKFKDA